MSGISSKIIGSMVGIWGGYSLVSYFDHTPNKSVSLSRREYNFLQALQVSMAISGGIVIGAL
jgi:hypothetical protein